jgi:DNA mismatch repair protein MutS2
LRRAKEYLAMAHKRIDEHTLEVLEFDGVRKSLASFASSMLGREAATALYPSSDTNWIIERMAETSELKALLARGVRIPLAGLRDIRTLIEGFGKKQTVFEPGELLEISDTLAASGRLKEFLNGPEAGQCTHLRAMGERLRDFERLVEEINRCIDGDKKVRDDASEKLRGIRRQIARLGGEIRRRFRKIVAQPQMRRALESDKLVMRHGRPVVAIKINYRHNLRGTVLDRSNSGATLYIEPDSLVECSNELEDALFEEKKEVGHILWELTKVVLDERKAILASVKALGLVDLTYAKARFSTAYDMAAPEIGKETFLRLRQARHPLLLRWASEQKGCEVREVMGAIVPIDVRLGDDFDLLLVTGPNAGGKTVMLKTTGLLTLMAQSGMHIPASPDSRIPVYRQIYADIGDEQSIQQNLSTFSAHMRQIVRILRATSQGTLVLLDELGAGTDPTEGASLAAAILEKLLKRGGHLIATTHLGQLKTYAYTTGRAQNASVQFDSETLAPTYRLLIGTPGSSNALAIARSLEVPKSVINKARSLLAQEVDGSTELIRQVQATREAAEQSRIEAQVALDEARRKRRLAAEELRRVREEERRLKDQADEEIENRMREVRELMRDFSRDMQNAPTAWRERADELGEKVSAAAASTPLAVRQAQFIEGLRAGDSVYIIPFRREGVVHRIHRKRKTVALFMESKQVKVGFDDICRAHRTGGT